MSAPESYHPQPDDLQNETVKSLTEVLDLQGPEPLITIPDEERAAEAAMTPYDRWQMDPSKSNLAAVTKSLSPTIESVIAGMGGAGNPHLRSRANVIAAKAVQTYDPSQGASLPTWVSGQLRQLSRDVRKSNNVLSIPEGVQLDSYALYKAEKEFEEEHDREPTVKELADASHLSVKRIEQIRKKTKAVVMDGATVGEDGSELVQGGETDYSKEAMDYVYNESDTTDQKLLEYLTGYGGVDQLDNKAIMQELKLTPVQLSRRKARLSMRMMEILNDLER